MSLAFKTKRGLLAYTLILGVLVSCGLSFIGRVYATAGINSQINFQGRLLNNQGATVADGFYNMEFKIYQDGDGASVGDTTGSPAGSLKWTEDYLNSSSQGVTVKNGFLSVQLGSVNPFGSSINWNSDTLWLSVNIGGTGSCASFSTCSPDGEMVPMKRLSANPYALNSGMLGGLTSGQFLQLGQGVQTDATTQNSIYVNKTGSGNIINLQSNGSDAFTVTNSGDITYGANANHALSVATAAASSAGKTLTINSGAAGSGGTALAGGNLVLQGGAGGGTNGSGGNVSIDAGAKNGTGSGGTIAIGATNASAISIGNSSATTTIAGNTAVTLDSGAGTTQVCRNGTGNLSSCDATYLTPTATNFIRNQSAAAQTNANFNIQAASGTVAATIQGASSQHILDVKDSSNTLDAYYDASGNYINATSIVIGTTTTGVAKLYVATSGVGETINVTGSNDILDLQKSSVTKVAFDSNGNQSTSANISITGSGAFGINNASAANPFAINTLTASQSGYQAAISTGATTNNGLVIQGVASQSTSSYYLNVTNSSGTSLFNVGGNGNVTVGNGGNLLISSGSIALQGSGLTSTTGIIRSTVAGTGGVTANDVVVIANDSGTAKAIDSTTAYDSRVFGVARNTVTAGSVFDVYISGTTTVSYTGTVPAIGDQLVVSATSGKVMVDNNATQGILGYATSAGSGGTVSVRVQITSGQTNPTFQGNATVGGSLNVGGQAVISSAGILQNAALSSSVNYSNLTQVGALTNGSIGTGFGVISTGNNIITTATLQGGTIQNTGSSFSVNSSGTVTALGFSGGTGGISTSGALSFSGTSTTSYVSPLGSNISTKINVPNYDPGAFGQIIALGLPSTANTNARAITLLDARTGTHQPTISVLSPNESQIFGLSWDGSNTTSLVKTTGQTLALQTAQGQLLSVTGYTASTKAVAAIGVSNSLAGTIELENASNSNAVQLQAGVTSATYITQLPTAIGTAGQCLSVASVASTTQSLGYNGCVTSVGAVSATATANGANITSGVLNLAVADGSNAGLVSATGQTIGGAKIFSGLLTGQAGATVTGGALNLTGNTASTLTTTSGLLTVQGAGGISLSATSTTVSGSITTGASAGTGTLTNNGSTVNSVLAISNSTGVFGTGTAAGTVDVYTAFSISAGVSGLTYTPPTPTANTTYGRIIYVSNVGSNIFTLGAYTLNPGGTATLIWSNTSGGASWQFAGADGSSILNQNSVTQPANFNINGTGTAGNFKVTPGTGVIDTATGGLLNVGTGTATSILIGSASSTANTIQAYNGTAVQSTNDSTSAFSVQNSVGASMISVDTTNTAASSTANLAVNGGSESTYGSEWTANGGGTVSRTTAAGEFVSGKAALKDVVTAANTGTQNNLGAALAVSNKYIVSFSARASTASAGNDLAANYYRTTGTLDSSCTSTLNSAQLTTTWFKYTCTFTTTATAGTTTAFLAITQTSTTSRNIFIDNLSVVQQNTTGAQNTGVVRIGGASGQNLTLFQLDTFAGTPFTGSNQALAGAMYFDTVQGKMQCYDGNVWGACGAAPTSNVTLTPEYTGAVLDGSNFSGSNIGTMTSDFCGSGGGLSINTSLCASGEARNFYDWTSPQSASQSYQIYVTYKLPTTFNAFVGGSTSLTARSDNLTNASASYAIFKSTGTTITSCSSSAYIVGGTASATVNTWQQGVAGTSTASGSTDPSGCSFAANNYVIFQITVTSKTNANAYVENLNFSYTNR